MLVALIVAAACTIDSANDQRASDAEIVELAWPDNEIATATSPDGLVMFELALSPTGTPTYRITRDGNEVIAPSSLGVQLRDLDASSAMTVADVAGPEPWTSSFEAVSGKRSSSAIEGEAMTVGFEHADGAAFDLEVVVTDGGAAFRYRVGASPADGANEDVLIRWERTTFSLAPEATSWMQPNDAPTMFTPAYEQLRSPATPVADLPAQANGWTLPALFEHDGVWLLVAEAGLTPPAAGTHLAPERVGGSFLFDPPQQGEGEGVGDTAVEGPGPINLPWRVFVIGDEAADIVETDLIRHLSDPPDDNADLEWIRPGRVSWSWWSDHASPRDEGELRRFIELAGDFGWEYSLVDANWNELPDGTIEELVAFATERDVELLLWYNSGGPNNPVTEAPRDLMFDQEVRRAEMARIAELGIAGIKVDFFHSDKPESIERYHSILQDAMDHELLVVFHGSTVPRGWSRTYPNLMTMEAVRGAEFYTFSSDYAETAPQQNATLPFTRNVVGSMDYTPVIVGDGDSPGRLTTTGHELALAVVFESALQHFVDTPEHYRALPQEAQNFLADVPVAWDDTVLLDGVPGVFVVMARRSGDAWWVGAINGTDEPRTVTLGSNDTRNSSNTAGSATVICDDAAGEQLVISTASLPTDVELAPYGGCVAF